MAKYGNIPKDIIRHHNKLKHHFAKQKQYRNSLISQAHEAIRSDIKLDSQMHYHYHNNAKAIVYYPDGSYRFLADVKSLNRKEHSHE